MKNILSFELVEDKLEIHLDNSGVDYLISQLEQLREREINDHLHLMSPEIGGAELTNEKQNLDEKSKLINHVKILYWNA